MAWCAFFLFSLAHACGRRGIELIVSYVLCCATSICSMRLVLVSSSAFLLTGMAGRVLDLFACLPVTE